jgi:hypothetical protein
MKPLHTIIAVVAATAAPAIAAPIGETFFEFDSAQLRADADARFAEVTDLADSASARLVHEAHTNAYGTERLDVALSARRSKAVQDALIDRGIAPACVLALYSMDAPDRESDAVYHRVMISLTAAPFYQIIDARLGDAAALDWSEPVTPAEAEIESPPAELERSRVAAIRDDL